ncbi:MAG: polysaccharide pyruvyl transferase family protein [Opitutales bacterium]|jgi:hypothetical protein|nr:polysaccharide pyruvyl transferase family protein [Opitutales bacterium]MDP4644011.1 polysaccharide pyruvyl transferase family protein [Opitutales bacterium]MDP4777037.1 polysaccharide pyruvyl transferase family protein [Opitutales bacterium]MDP4882667.1 polysaccharide pyruvyl transferase family protein [Opitutales bacterium]MDP5080964.1 polysaccharide pyruvyl transferase family protein [Opitutales bacterium]
MKTSSILNEIEQYQAPNGIGPKVVFVGDTSLRTPHFGCQLVGQTFREQFVRVGMELIASLPTSFERASNWRTHFDRADLIVINGEGSIHHGRFQELIDLASKFPVALVNCVYQENPENPNLLKLKYVSARESMSANALIQLGAEAEVVPDVLFASSFLRSFVPLNSADKEIGVTDSAKKEIKSFGPFSIRYRPGYSPKAKVVGDYLHYLTSHKRMCIGRFHAVIAASVLEIPFSCWDSNTWKTEGLMKDMGVAHLHFSSRKEAMANVPLEFPSEIRQFSQDARLRVEAMFNRLAEIAHG